MFSALVCYYEAVRLNSNIFLVNYIMEQGKNKKTAHTERQLFYKTG